MSANFLPIVIIAVVIFVISPTTTDSRFGHVSNRSFVIDHDQGCFLKDGACYQFVSGSVHYFRIPKQYWQDRLLRLRAAGLDVVQTYVMWNFHERTPGQYTFEGDADLVGFIKIAQQLGLLVILRPGPYIDNDVDFGGLPWWLLKEQPPIQIRSADTRFMFYVKRWLDVLLPKLVNLTYNNGGNIISMQVENEYGSFGCNSTYRTELAKIYFDNIGRDLILFTTDGAGIGMVQCGHTDGIFTTVDFGPAPTAAIEAAFKLQMQFNGNRGPKICSEFYPGWEDVWGGPHHLGATDPVIQSIHDIWTMNGSVNMFMFEGGTNFGYWAGSEGVGPTAFGAVTTSYDYDAPLSEAGDPRPKYIAIRNLMQQLKGGTPLPYPVPPSNPTASYEPATLKLVTSLTEMMINLSAVQNFNHSNWPISFEDLNIDYGFAVYNTTLKTAGNNLSFLVESVHDRAYVYVNQGQTLLGIIQRPFAVVQNITYQFQPGQTVHILVENQGRPCAGITQDWWNFRAGILKNITLDGVNVTDWTMYRLNIEQYTKSFFAGAPTRFKDTRRQKVRIGSASPPGIYAGTFSVPQIADTYLDPSGWGKGQVFINGFNIGRYWPDKGPQVTLYIPKYYLKQPTSSIVVFELETVTTCQSATGTGCAMKFSKEFIWKNTTIISPSNMKNRKMQPSLLV